MSRLGKTDPASDLPDDVAVEAVAAKDGDGLVVALDIEGTTFLLHPADAGLIGAALVKRAAEANEKSSA